MDPKLPASATVFAQFVKINRKRFWVIRWVEISIDVSICHYDEGVLIYKEKPSDKQPRAQYNLSEGNVQERIDSDGEMVILQMLKGEKEKIKLMASTRQEHQALVEKLKYYSKLKLLKPSPNKPDPETPVVDPQRAHRASFQMLIQKQRDEGREPQRFVVDDDLIRNTIADGLLLKLKANCNLMIGQMNERNPVRVDTSKDLETFTAPKKNDKNAKSAEPGKHTTISTRISASFHKDIQLLGAPLVIVIGLMFFILTSLLMYLLLILVDSSVYFYSCALTLNLLVLPIISIRFLDLKKGTQSHTLGKSSTKIQCIAKLNVDVNEFLFILRSHELRKQWQPFILDIQYKDLGQYKISFYGDNFSNTEESFIQNVYKEDNSVFVVEHTNFNILRVFHAAWQPQDDEEDRFITLKYYSKVPDDLDLGNSYNGQVAIRGLQQLIKSQKSNPKSPLFDYLQRSIQKLQVRPPLEQKQEQRNEQKQSEKLQASDLSEEQKQIQPPTQSISIIHPVEVEEFKDQPEVPKPPPLTGDALKYNKLSEDSKILLEKEAALTPENGWIQKDNSNGFCIHVRQDPKSGNSFSRGEGVIPYSIDELFPIISDVTRRGEYDELFETGHVVKAIDETQSYAIVYQKFKSMFVVSSRDFVILTRRFINPDNSWTVIAVSIETNELPEKKGAVRGQLVIGGWLLKPLTSTSVNATFAVLVDPKGSIPQSIVAKTATIQGMCVQKIKKVLDKEHKKK